jgi:4-amino-4-deoxy-L-arabinose transferase-like glycosyltransferase
VPSLLGAIGAVLLTYWAALVFVTRRAALLAGLMMATCVLLNVEARLAKTDAVLLMCCVAAMGVMARAYLFQSTGRDIPWRHALLLWTALAAGILLKGPLILMVVGLAALALTIVDRSGGWLMRLRPMVGVLWILLLVLPWFVAIMGRAGESFFQWFSTSPRVCVRAFEAQLPAPVGQLRACLRRVAHGAGALHQ